MFSATKGSAVVDGRISNTGHRGVATDELRRHNLSAVLDRLHLSGPLSRSELANQTGLNRSTIRDLLAELSDLGLVAETKGAPSAGPGRPSSVAQVVPTGAVVLAVELEVDSVAVATVGLGGHIFAEVREPNTRKNISPGDIAVRLADLARPLLEELPPDSNLAGVGVAVAGVVRRSDGFVHVAPNLGWIDVPIAELIRSQLDIGLVRVGNEADLGALGEYRRGVATRSRHMIFVTGEVGVGVGIIQEAAPMLGVSGYAGEAGHTMVNPEGSPCRCGSIGCWETEVGEEALVRRAGLEPASVSLLDSIVERAETGHPDTRSALWETGKWLGIGIGNLINILNPDMVVVGGIYQRFYPYMAAAIEVGIKDIALEAPGEACTVVASGLGENVFLIGAAELVLGEVVSDPLALGDAAVTRG